MANNEISGPKTTLLFLAEVLGFTLLLQAVTAPVWRFAGDALAGQLGAWLIYGLAAGLLGWLFNRILRKEGLRALGFRYSKGFWKDVWFGVLGYAVLCVLCLPMDIAALPDRAKMIGQMIGSGYSTVQILAIGSLFAIVLGFVTGAFNEEIRFRGYYQGAAARELSPLAGFMIALLPFSFGHYFAHPEWSVLQVLATVLPGVVYGLLYNVTGSLVAVMTAHTLTNWIGAYPALVYSATHDRAAGLITLAGLAVGFVLLIWVRRNLEMRAWFALSARLFREHTAFGLVTGSLIGLALLGLWAVHVPAVYAGAAGLGLFGAVVGFRRKMVLKTAD